jgi:probable rRNA maturation factor
MKQEINFFNERISYVVRKKRQLRKWLVMVAEHEGKLAGTLNYIICDDDYLAELNLKYLKHKSLTDILTFSFTDEVEIVKGDIFISLTRVRDNAKKYKQKVEVELYRVMVHGLLHLAGYDDASGPEKKLMRDKENYYLQLLHNSPI